MATFRDLWWPIVAQTVRKIDKRVLMRGFRTTETGWEDYRRLAFREVIRMLEVALEAPPEGDDQK